MPIVTTKETMLIRLSRSELEELKNSEMVVEKNGLKAHLHYSENLRELLTISEIEECDFRVNLTDDRLGKLKNGLRLSFNGCSPKAYKVVLECK